MRFLVSDLKKSRVQVNYRGSKCEVICKHFITDSTGTRIAEGCKTNAGDRWLYMDDETADMLKEYQKHYGEVAKTYGSKACRTQQTGCNTSHLHSYPQRQRPSLLRGSHPGDTEKAQVQNGLTACKKDLLNAVWNNLQQLKS